MKNKLDHLGMRQLGSPFSEALRKAQGMMTSETICKECSEIMSDEEVLACEDMCFECYGKDDFGDICPDHPDNLGKGIK